MEFALTLILWIIGAGLALSIVGYVIVFVIQLCIARKVYKEIKKIEEEN